MENILEREKAVALREQQLEALSVELAHREAKLKDVEGLLSRLALGDDDERPSWRERAMRRVVQHQRTPPRCARTRPASSRRPSPTKATTTPGRLRTGFACRAHDTKDKPRPFR